MDERSTPTSFDRSSGMDTGDSTNVAMVGQAGSVDQSSSMECASSVSALENITSHEGGPWTEVSRGSNVAANGQPDAHDISVPRSISDAGSNGGAGSTMLPLTNQFDALSKVRSRSRSPGPGDQTPNRGSGGVTPTSAFVGRSGRSTPKSGGGSNFGRTTLTADQKLDLELLNVRSPGGRSQGSDRLEGTPLSHIPNFTAPTSLRGLLSSPGSVAGSQTSRYPLPQEHGNGAASSHGLSPEGVTPSGTVNTGDRSGLSLQRSTVDHVSMMVVPSNTGSTVAMVGSANIVSDNAMAVEEEWRNRVNKRELCNSSSSGDGKRAITGFTPSPITPPVDPLPSNEKYFPPNQTFLPQDSQWNMMLRDFQVAQSEVVAETQVARAALHSAYKSEASGQAYKEEVQNYINAHL